MTAETMSRLESGDWSVEVDAARGGLIRACRWRGRDVLVPAKAGVWPEGADAGCFPLVPFSNRIRGAEFSFLGQRIRLPAPVFAAPHALHGLGWRRIWQIHPSSANEIVMLHANPGGAWPWPYEARQTLSVAGDRLSLTLSLKNTGALTMPAGIGFHPYFPRSPDLQVSASADGYWQTAAADPGIPTGWSPIAPETDVFKDKDTAGADLDNCFTGWNRQARLAYTKARYRIDLGASAAFSNLVIYCPPGRDFLCLEPVSHVNDAVSLSGIGAAQQMDHLEPGETLEGTLHFDVTQTD